MRFSCKRVLVWEDSGMKPALVVRPLTEREQHQLPIEVQASDTFRLRRVHIPLARARTVARPSVCSARVLAHASR